MRILISEVRSAIALKLFGPAVIALFAIPDAAATVEYGFEPPRVRYPKWFDKFVDDKAAGGMGGNFAWLVRNALLHETAVNWRSVGFDADRLMITVASPTSGGIHGLSIIGSDDSDKPAGVMELKLLSDAILAGAERWLDEVEQDPARKARLDGMMQYRHNGFGLIGVPVIT